MAEGRPDCRKVDWLSTGQPGVQEVADGPYSGLRHAGKMKGMVPKAHGIKKVQNDAFKCKVQTLYSPGIAQGHVVL